MSLGEPFDPILSAARAGADWAWERLYRELAPPVLAYLRSRGARDPEDVLGEVFLQAVRGLPRFEGDERDLRTWVLTIAHRKLVDEHRKTARRPITVPDEELYRTGATGDAELEGLAALGTNRALVLIRSLAPDQQNVLLLRVFADLTIEEIARVLAKKPGAIKALQRRGLAALKKKLSKEGVPL
jgi:RNA polymerase sigma-70 factor (ECF subfamily)